jgi:hypothetical protein
LHLREHEIACRIDCDISAGSTATLVPVGDAPARLLANDTLTVCRFALVVSLEHAAKDPITNIAASGFMAFKSFTVISPPSVGPRDEIVI